MSVCLANQNLFAFICDWMAPVGNQPNFIVTPFDTCAALSYQMHGLMAAFMSLQEDMGEAFVRRC